MAHIKIEVKSEEKPWFPRKFWSIKPFDRIKESKKLYRRSREKAKVRKLIDEMLTSNDLDQGGQIYLMKQNGFRGGNYDKAV